MLCLIQVWLDLTYHLNLNQTFKFGWCVYVCMYVCVYVCMYVCIYLSVCVCVHVSRVFVYG